MLTLPEPSAPIPGRVLIIRRFLQWAATAPADARAEGASALARAYVCDEFEAAEEADAVAAMFALLDDPAPDVRRALAQALAPSPKTPAPLLTALIADGPEIAALALEFSPVLASSELVDAVAVGEAVVQGAVARRAGLTVGLSAALAEVGCLAACIELCRNETASIPDSAFDRMIARFGDRGELRAAIASRESLSSNLRCDLVQETARTLAAFVTSVGWLGADRAGRVTRDASEQACLTIAADAEAGAGPAGLTRLVRHLRHTGCLTPALILRAILCGNRALFETAVSELSGLPRQRVAGLTSSGRGLGFQSLYARAGLPAALRPAFAAALERADRDEGRGTALQRGRISQALAALRERGVGDVGAVTALLRRLDAQAAREEARSYARDVMRTGTLMLLPRPTAADRTFALPTAA